MGENGRSRKTPPAGSPGGGPRHAGITDVSYRPSLGAPLGMDVLDFEELLRRGRRRGIPLSSPMRPTFHHLLHVRSGTLGHTVDFSEHVLGAGDWLWVRAGQVHQYHPAGLRAARGTFVIWQPGFVTAQPPYEQSPVRPAGRHLAAVDLALRHLEEEYADLASLPLDVHVETLRMLLGVLLLRLAHAGPGTAPSPAGGEAFRAYSAAVERDFAGTHRVGDYAAALGWSTRTLTRATLAATGSTAKQYLDARVLLEAKRLLVHTEAASAEVARQVGFRDPGDFAKFFRARDGRTPLEFRAQARGRPAPHRPGRRGGG
ncbi:helix-turn-helix domain-containing protein [Streptomyces sp. NPDC059740]|uniref:helix-turn-helix domain-containing protein n=1 Tax=Streptomyces sp. NPDC059740 TaxID=3346926 RepID=UPI0036516F3B